MTKTKIPQKVKDRVFDKVRECQEIIQRKYGKTVDPVVTFDLRGSCAGRGGLKNGQQIIRLNSVLLVENEEDMINNTVPHEFAHVAQYVLYGRSYDNKPHGRYWKEIMRKLGVEATRCHSYDVSNAVSRKRNRITYHCECQTHSVTVRMHNKIQSGQRRWCLRCKHVLALPGQPIRHKDATKEVKVSEILKSNVFQHPLYTPPTRVEVREEAEPTKHLRPSWNSLTLTFENVEVID